MHLIISIRSKTNFLNEGGYMSGDLNMFSWFSVLSVALVHCLEKMIAKCLWKQC